MDISSLTVLIPTADPGIAEPQLTRPRLAALCFIALIQVS